MLRANNDGETKWLYIIPLSYSIPIILEYLVTINVYNADIFNFMNMPDAFEYALMDVIPLFVILFVIVKWRYIDAFDFFGVFIALLAHLQWYLHSPFEKWPIGGKSENDIRHRTEWYDTHVMVFSIYIGLLLRWFPKK